MKGQVRWEEGVVRWEAVVTDGLVWRRGACSDEQAGDGRTSLGQVTAREGSTMAVSGHRDRP